MDSYFPSVPFNREKSTRVLRRTTVLREINRMNRGSAIDAVRSLRMKREQSAVERDALLTVDGAKKLQITSSTIALQLKSTSLLSSMSPHPIYQDVAMTWKSRVGKRDIRKNCSAVAIRSSKHHNRSFWYLRQKILKFQPEIFLEIYKCSCTRILRGNAIVTIESFIKIFEDVIQCSLTFLDAWFLFSLLCDQRSNVRLADFSKSLPVLFISDEIFSVLACKHIGEKDYWPSCLFLWHYEVVELLCTVKRAMASQNKCVETMVNEILKSLRVLGFIDVVPLQSFHNILKKIIFTGVPENFSFHELCLK